MKCARVRLFGLAFVCLLLVEFLFINSFLKFPLKAKHSCAWKTLAFLLMVFTNRFVDLSTLVAIYLSEVE